MIDNIIANINDNKDIKMIKYQDEVCPRTGRKHRQTALLLHKQLRFSTLSALLPGVHIEPARDWINLLAYCEKTDTRDLSGSQVTAKSTYKHIQLHDMLTDFGDIYIRLNPTECPICNITDCKCSVMVDKQDVSDYWVIANVYMRSHPEMCHLVGSPIAQTLWKRSRDVWVDRAYSITPGPSGPPGPRNEILSSPYVSNACSSSSCSSRSSASTEA